MTSPVVLALAERDARFELLLSSRLRIEEAMGDNTDDPTWAVLAGTMLWVPPFVAALRGVGIGLHPAPRREADAELIRAALIDGIRRVRHPRESIVQTLIAERQV